MLVPVLPSDIDIHAAAKCISNLLLIAKIRRDEHRIAVIANRVKKQTLVYKSLMKFLEKLQIPVIATLRDSQAYIRSAEIGSGVFEMKPNLVREDLEQWLPLVGWLAQRKPLHIEPGSPAITSALTSAPKVADDDAGIDRSRRSPRPDRAGRSDAARNCRRSILLSKPARPAPPPLSPTRSARTWSSPRRPSRCCPLCSNACSAKPQQSPRRSRDRSQALARYLPFLSFSLSQLLRTLSVQLL